MSTLATVATRGWFGGDTAARFALVGLEGWFDGATTSGSDRDLTSLRVTLRQRLVTDGTLLSLLTTASAVFHHYPPLPAPENCIVYELIEIDPGRFSLRLRLRAGSAATLDDMLDSVARLLEGYRSDTTDWLIRRISLDTTKPSAVTRTQRGSSYEQEVYYTLNAYERSAESSAVSTTITLSKDTTSLTLPVPDTLARERKRLQSRGESSSGTVFIYDSGRGQVVHALTFETLDESDADGLRDFYTLVAGMRETFSWTDRSGTLRTVRFAENTLLLQRTAIDFWRVTLRLEEV